jgi:hypothetical protein
MFAILGVKASLCQGKVFIGPDADRRIFDVEPHDFVIVEEPLCLFDSSVTFRGISGIPCKHSDLYPDFGAGLFTTKPTSEDFTRELVASNKPYFALYAARVRKPPSEHTVRWTSDTPFGCWLMDLLGSQVGIWGKAAFCAAEVYAGRSPMFPFDGLDRATMWREVAATPDRDEFIIGRLV